MHHRSWHWPLNCRCSWLFMGKRLLWSVFPLLYHTPTHSTMIHSSRGTLISLHVRTRRPLQWTVMPKFPENWFILVATCRAKAYLLIWLALLMERNTLSSDSLIQPPFFPNTLICLMLGTANDDSVWNGPLFHKKKKNKQRLQGLIKLIDGDGLAELWTLKMMTSLWMGRLWEKTCYWQWLLEPTGHSQALSQSAKARFFTPY